MAPNPSIELRAQITVPHYALPLPTRFVALLYGPQSDRIVLGFIRYRVVCDALSFALTQT